MAGKAKKRPRKPDTLTLREIKFCQFFFQHGNARKAYMDAGLPGELSDPAGSSYVDKAASLLVRKGKVKNYLAKLEEDAFIEAQVTTADLVKGYRRAEQINLSETMKKDGTVIPPPQWPKDLQLCLKSYERKPITEMMWVEEKIIAKNEDGSDKLDEEGKQTYTTINVKRKVVIAVQWKFVFEDKTECRNMLAKWKRMISDDPELMRMGVKIDELERRLTARSVEPDRGEDSPEETRKPDELPDNAPDPASI